MSRKIVKHKWQYVKNGHRDRLYKVYVLMCQRCYYDKYKFFHRYGGRGITVCEEWLNSYDKFKEWALANGYDYTAPKGRCTLDRIDNDANYEPNNCRWVTIKEQLNNNSQNVFIKANGKNLTLQQWAEMLGTTHATLRSRYRRGWDGEKIINTPIRSYRKECACD